jgi:ferredoxin-type protein NapF
LIAAVWILAKSAGVPPWPAAVASLSPFVAIASLLATRAIQGMTWLGLVVAVIALVRRRWFCRWVCPTGLCADGAGMLGLRLRRRRARPPALGRRGLRLPALGRWALLLTLGGACAGYPLLLWLDPLAIFSSPFGAFRARGAAAAAWSAALMTSVLLASLILPGAWCGRLCPLGSLQDLLAGAARGARRMLARSRGDEAARPRSGLPRRVVVGGIAGLLWAAGTRWARGAAPRPLRPPGAAGEDRFTGLCIRCGNCARACPASIIQPDLGEHGLAGFLAPKLEFKGDYCREDCTLCTEVCPSGAIVRVKPEDKARARIGLPRVDMRSCWLGEDRECSACRNQCPYDAIRYVFSEAEYTLTPRVDPEKCPGCGACEAACPATPAKAIVVVPCFRA